MTYLKITGLVHKEQMPFKKKSMFCTIPGIDKCLKNSNEKCEENKICKQVNDTVVCLSGMVLLFRIVEW